MRVMILGNVITHRTGPTPPTTVGRMMVTEIPDDADAEAWLRAIGRMHDFDMSYGVVAIPVVAAVGGPLGKGPQ